MLSMFFLMSIHYKKLKILLKIRTGCLVFVNYRCIHLSLFFLGCFLSNPTSLKKKNKEKNRKFGKGNETNCTFQLTDQLANIIAD